MKLFGWNTISKEPFIYKVMGGLGVSSLLDTFPPDPL